MKSFRGRLLNRRLPRRVVTTLVLGLGLAVSAGTVQAVPLDRAAGTDRPGVRDLGDPVRGTDAKAAPRGADPARAAAVKLLDEAAWPEPGSTALPVAAHGRKATVADVGGLPVTVTAPPEPDGRAGAAARSTRGTGDAGAAPAAAGAAPEKVRVSALDRDRARGLGSAALLKVQRADGGDTPAKVELTVDYSAFAEAYGGGYGARLRLVQLPACATTAPPGSAACPQLPEPLETENDPARGTVTAQVDALPQPRGVTPQTGEAAPLVAVQAGDSSAQGDYKATPLAPSASWSVATSSGGFSWSYPFRTVPTPGGLTPQIGLSYSSQGVDGRTSTTNNQGS
ncbi:hypothetical protein V1J52_22165, partial [Streptomyces sp. TRM 70351]|nr:hypothetical protein [Streptomyces sp. TRM 70351]